MSFLPPPRLSASWSARSPGAIFGPRESTEAPPRQAASPPAGRQAQLTAKTLPRRTNGSRAYFRGLALPEHRHVGRDGVLADAPFLRRAGLVGGFQFSDALTDDYPVCAWPNFAVDGLQS